MGINTKHAELDASRWAQAAGYGDKEVDNPPTITAQLKGFCSETSAHGVGQIVKDGGFTWFKVTWFVIVLIMLAGGTVHLYYVVQTYTSYPSQETTSFSSRDPEFPYVTICNAQATSPSNHQTLINNSLSNYAQYHNMIYSMTDEIFVFELDFDYALDDLLLSPGTVYANVGTETVRAVSHQFNNFILSCRYLGENCDMESDWVEFLDEEFYTCFTFIGSRGSNEGKSAPGPQNGLSVILYMENMVEGLSEYLTYNIYSNVQNSFGARIEIHERETLPIPSLMGFDIMPGHSTSIGLRETVVKKLPHPWGKCSQRKHLDQINAYKYSAHACLAMCMTKYVYRNCGCIIHNTPILDSVNERNDESCAYFDNDTVTLPLFINRMDCAHEKQRQFHFSRKIRNSCNCPEACKYHDYNVLISENIWPAERFHLDAFNTFALEREDFDSLSATQQMYNAWEQALYDTSQLEQFSRLMYANFARINIYFETSHVTKRVQTTSVGIGDMFASFGGTMGLWAGISICTIAEIIILCVNVCILGCKKLARRKEVPVAPVEKATNAST